MIKRRQFEEFYENYKKLLFYVAKQILKDDFLAEDAVSDAFLKIFRNYKKFMEKEENAAKNLAVLVVKNCSIDILRKNNRVEAVEFLEKEEKGEGVEERVLAKMDCNQIVQCIKELSDTDQIILSMRCIQELSEKETAQLLGIKPKAVGMRLNRARKHLRILLENLEKEG